MNAEATLCRFLKSRIAGMQNSDGSCLFEDGIRVEAKVHWGPQYPQGRAVMVVFQAFHDLFPGGITDFAVAAGETPEEALEKASLTWLEGTRPVLQALVNDRDCRHDSVDVFDIAVVNSVNKQASNWEMLRGPLQTMGYGTDWAEAALGMNDCILKTIIDACSQTGVFAGSRPHSVRWSIARSPGEPYHGECLLDGEPWQAGGDALAAVSQIMTRHFDDATDFHIARQFCVCRPTHRSCPVAEDAALKRLRELERHAPKRRWRLW